MAINTNLLLTLVITVFCSATAQQTTHPPALDTNIAMYDLITSAGVNLKNVPASITSQLGHLHPFATDYSQQLASFADALPSDQCAEFEQGLSVGQSLASQALAAAATQGNHATATEIVDSGPTNDASSSSKDISKAPSMKVDRFFACRTMGISVFIGLIISF